MGSLLPLLLCLLGLLGLLLPLLGLLGLFLPLLMGLLLLLWMVPLLEMALWLKIVAWVVLLSSMIGVALALLPPFKAVLFNLQLANKAEEAQWQSTGKHGTPPKGWKN